MSKEAMKMALEALDGLSEPYDILKAQDAIKEALAQPEQEPVAKVVSTAPERIWLDLGFDPADEDDISFHDLVDTTWSEDNATGYGIEHVRADTTPPQRKPLTDEEIDALSREMVKGNKSVNWLCRAIEAAHGIKGEA